MRSDRLTIPALWKRLGTDTLWLALSRPGSQAMTLLFTVLVARRLLPAALAVQLTLAALFIILVFLGAPALSNQTWEAVQALQVYSLVLFPLAFYTVFSAALHGYQHMDAFM